MIYERSLTITAAHFNETAYMKFEDMRDQIGAMQVPEMDALIDLLQDSHGHNFRVVVHLESDKTLGAYSGYIIDDETLLACLLEWEGINISLHPDFRLARRRATTENMAEILCHKVGNLIHAPGSTVVTVTVYETPDIRAVVQHTFIRQS